MGTAHTVMFYVILNTHNSNFAIERAHSSRCARSQKCMHSTSIIVNMYMHSNYSLQYVFLALSAVIYLRNELCVYLGQEVFQVLCPALPEQGHHETEA